MSDIPEARTEVVFNGRALSLSLAAGQCHPHLGAVRPADGLGDPGAGGGKCLEVDAGLDAEAVEQVDHVFACHVARCPFRVGAAAEAGDGAVYHRNAFFQHRVEVGQRLAVGVVEVGGELGHGHLAAHRLEHALGLEGGAHADGVAQRHLVAAHLIERLGHFGHLGRGDLALVGAAQHRGDVAAHPHAGGLGAFQHRFEARQGLGHGAVDVLLGEGLGGGAEHRHLLDAALQGRFQPLEVGGQRRVGDAIQPGEVLHHLAVVGHLRHPLGRDEAGRLDVAEAGRAQAVDQLQLGGGADRLGLVLQAVAGADLDQANLFRECHWLTPPGRIRAARRPGPRCRRRRSGSSPRGHRRGRTWCAPSSWLP